MSFPTSDLMDAFPDAPSCDLQFRPFGQKRAFGGKIRTARILGDNALVKQILATPGDGCVLVVDGGGSLHSALMGDMIGASAVKNGWVGVIINGAVRDAVALDQLDLGVKALGTNPRKSDKRGDGAADVAVHFGGVTFTPGHYVYSDEDGIVVLEQAYSPS
ncbi:ribonuclease E activity regulator RraA [Burkholderiaceae bacterium DAT-1]|nr:ribonuclease E activity regulator RraA [Burkholderiaceae bacterium DAT-1]